MSNPKISIIVPYYNSELYLNKCISSILSQTLTDFELILVDDGSTDSSYSICKSFASKDSRIVLLQKENGGQGSARNYALDLANGTFIGFVDSDDYIDSNMYEVLYENCITHEATLAVCGYKTFRTEKIAPSNLQNVGKKIFDNFSLMESYLLTSLISSGPCNKLYDRELFCNVRFPAFRVAEDAFVLPLIFVNVEKAVYVGKNLYNWHLRMGSTERSKFTIMHLSAINAVDCLSSIIKENYVDLIKYLPLEQVRVRLSLIEHIIISNSVSTHKDIYEKLLDEISLELKEGNMLAEEFPKIYKKALFVNNYNFLFRTKVKFSALIKDFIKNLISKL